MITSVLLFEEPDTSSPCQKFKMHNACYGLVPLKVTAKQNQLGNKTVSKKELQLKCNI
jgi:hypothetical protein